MYSLSSEYNSAKSYSVQQIVSSTGEYLGNKLEQNRYTGISAQEFLKRALVVSSEEWDSLADQVKSVAVHQTEAYLGLQEELIENSELSEGGMHTPFASMANMILEGHRDLSAHSIKVLPSNSHSFDPAESPTHEGGIFGAVLVPRKDGGKKITVNNLRYRHMLLVMQFQQNQVLDRKRARDYEGGSGGERPAKRRRCLTERCCVSSPAIMPETHTYSPDMTEGELRLAGHAADVMTELSGRTFTFGAIVSGTCVRLTFYSRSAYIVSRPFDIARDPVTFSLLLILFSKQPLDRLGFNVDMSYCDPFDSKADRNLKLKLDPVEDGGDNFEVKPDVEFKLGECIHSEYCLIGRGTAVYDIVCPEGCEIDMLLKFSWQMKESNREDIAIRIARSANATHSPEIYGYAAIPDNTPSKSLIAGCAPNHETSQPIEDIELRVMLMRKYSSVEELNDDEFYEIVPQLSAYLHDLYQKKGLLHRDVSIYNMAFYRKLGKVFGVLIDFDLADYPEEAALPFIETTTSSQPLPRDSSAIITSIQENISPKPDEDAPLTINDRPHRRPGTLPFMAVEVLDWEASNYKHHLCHDLESLLYAVVWHGLGYRDKTHVYPMPKDAWKDYLMGWRMGSWSDVMKDKKSFLSDPTHIAMGIKHHGLKIICLVLALFFRNKREDARLAREDWEMLQLLRKRNEIFAGDLDMDAPFWEYDKAIYPVFADILLIEAVECKKDCCVSTWDSVSTADATPLAS